MEKKEEHPILKEMLTPEFLKQFKNSKDLNEFIDQLFVKGMEQMLEGELDGHLGYAKHSPEGINSGNSRNGKTTKKVRQNGVNLSFRYHVIAIVRLSLLLYPSAADS